MLQFINNRNLDKLLNSNGNRLLIVTIPTNFKKHWTDNKISILYIFDLDYEFEYVISVNHNDLPNIDINTILTYLSPHEDSIGTNIEMLPTLNLIDFEFVYWWVTNAHYNHYKLFKDSIHGFTDDNVNNYVPLTQLYEKSVTIKNILKGMYDILNLNTLKPYFKAVYKQFKLIECNVIPINLNALNVKFNTDTIKNNYNLFTATGRPSNSYNHVNLAALNKSDGSRSIIQASPGKILVEFDFEAYHLRLIANLIGYALPPGNIHDYFGRQFFNTPILTDEQYKTSKELSFRMAYGSIIKEYAHIPFFQAVHEYIKTLFVEFNKNGYVETVVYKRKIFKSNFQDMTPNKLFNYLLQSYETEHNSIFINDINTYLMDKKSIFILYTYDSFLFEITKEELKMVIHHLNDILNTNGFRTNIKAGKTYNDLRGITI